MGKFPVFLACLFCFFFLTVTSTIPDIIKPSQTIRDGETLVSIWGSFELGFFSPGSSKNRYLGIWYKSDFTVVWVANREDPLSNTLGALNITSTGMLILYNTINDTIVWSSIPSRAAEDPVAELLESGNLVVREGSDDNPENFLWQSFDDPCDTLLPGMKLGFNMVTRLDRFLSSWKSREDPARGKYSFHIDPNDGHPQLLLKLGNSTLSRATPTNPNNALGQNSTEFLFNDNEVSFGYAIKPSGFSRLTLSPSGSLQSLTWNNQTHVWLLLRTGLLIDQCQVYALCGANAGCDINSSPTCACFNGFMPKNPKEWDLFDWSGGCIRRIPLNCSDTEGFMKIEVNKLPETSSSWFDKGMNLKECGGFCLKNCFCTAYAHSNITEAGNGCLIWSGDLIDTGSSTGDVHLYVRIPLSTSGVAVKKGNNSGKKKAGIIVSTTVLGMGLVILSGMIFCLRRKNLRNNHNFDEVRKEEMELPIFYLSTIAHATGNFSTDNKLGEGGFGPVYKGILTGGQEIAVKRLSKSSGQGLNEFKNEVILIAKLQHRNLVKLLGCCIHEDEKMLIYEYMPNKSLDFIIFDQTRRKTLDWSKRMNIIGGIARGLLYLHQDSRLKIIHRDIKASNILLDKELNPKISDFGLARMFRGDQTEVNTHRVVGTYGYMSPEYASDGHLSVKTDVFSFGVLVLEMVNGNKNRGFRHPEQNLNLLGHAWTLWIKGTPLELIDECLAYSSKLSEVLRCIHVALLCVQQRPEDRPNMSTVVQILGNENPLPQPKQPGFFMGRNPIEQDTSSNRNEAFSVNGVSLTSLEAR